MKKIVLNPLWIVILIVALTGCRSTLEKRTEMSSEGNTVEVTQRVNNKVVSELRRVFEGTILEGNGMFESDNEGLARRTATNLAVAELAGQVQTKVKAESVIYNNKDVRDVVDNRVKALVNDYRIDQAGYDPGTYKYRVRVVIKGEKLVSEMERRIR